MSVGAISEISRCRGCISALRPEMYTLPGALSVPGLPFPPDVSTSFRITDAPKRETKIRYAESSGASKSTVLAK